MRTQRPLREAPTDADGRVRFLCELCGRRSDIALADLIARYGPGAGLVDVLNQTLPRACAGSRADEPDRPRCGFHYRDLADRLPGS